MICEENAMTQTVFLSIFFLPVILHEDIFVQEKSHDDFTPGLIGKRSDTSSWLGFNFF